MLNRIKLIKLFSTLADRFDPVFHDGVSRLLERFELDQKSVRRRCFRKHYASDSKCSSNQ